MEPGPLRAPTVDAERDLMLELLRLPEVVGRAIALRSPNHVAEFAFDVAGRFNRFYDACHILSEPDWRGLTFPSPHGRWPRSSACWISSASKSLTGCSRGVPSSAPPGPRTSPRSGPGLRTPLVGGTMSPR